MAMSALIVFDAWIEVAVAVEAIVKRLSTIWGVPYVVPSARRASPG
jgi:hypothetical protein